MKEPSIIKFSDIAISGRKAKYKFKRTGNIAVDTVTALLNHYKGLPIREIFLFPQYYFLFQNHVAAQMKKQNQVFERGQRMSYSGVDIKSRFMAKTIQWVFENQKTGEA